MNRPARGRAAARVLRLALFLLVLSPVMLVVVLGLSVDPTVRFPPSGLTLSRASDLWADSRWSSSIVLSLGVAFVSSSVATAVACVLAIGVRGASRAVNAAVMFVVGAAAVTPTVLQALGLVILANVLVLDPVLLLGWAHVIICLPFAFLVMRLGTQTLRPTLIESAHLLGARRTQVLWFVVVPHLGPFAAMAVLLSSVVSFAEPVIASFVLSDGRATVAQRSFQGLRFSLETSVMTAGAWTAALAAVVVGLLALLGWWLGRVSQGSLSDLSGTQ